MQKEHLINTLLELGLKENEAKIYLAGLSLGPTTILKLASITNIKRPSVYPVVENLRERGLMSLEVRGFKQLYVAEPPEKLEFILEERKSKFKNALPDFSRLYNLQEQNDLIKIYNGLTAVKTIYEDLITSIRPKEDYSIISDQSEWLALDEKYFRDFTARRAKLNINIRLLLTDSAAAREYKKYEKNYNIKIKFLPQGTKLTTNLVIIPQKVLIHQLVAPIIGIVIENKSVIQMHRQTFEIMWNALQE